MVLSVPASCFPCSVCLCVVCLLTHGFCVAMFFQFCSVCVCFHCKGAWEIMCPRLLWSEWMIKGMNHLITTQMHLLWRWRVGLCIYSYKLPEEASLMMTGLGTVLLHHVMLCPVDIPGRPLLFWRETEDKWIFGRVQRGSGRSRRRGNCGLDIFYERKINTKTLKAPFLIQHWTRLTLLQSLRLSLPSDSHLRVVDTEKNNSIKYSETKDKPMTLTIWAFLFQIPFVL